MTSVLKLKRLLHLGVIDADNFSAFQRKRNTYFKNYHQRFWNNMLLKDENGRYTIPDPKRAMFRGESLNEWIEPKAIPGNDVKALQTFLHQRGFMPGARIDGVFGYWTLASVRLFQEYIRTVEGIDIGIADGRVWKGTHQHMIRWVENDLYCEWGPERSTDPQKEFSWPRSSREYDLWMELLPKVKDHYLKALKNAADPAEDTNLFEMQEVRKYTKKTDTIKIDDWSFDRNDIHLVGLRCHQEQANRERGNDDLFVLLINGMVFKFWGSTDPRPDHTSDGYEPYLVEGQHKYRLSWHKVTTGSVKKVYKALTPYQYGVLVNRDWSQQNKLTETDIRKGLNYNKAKVERKKNWRERENPNSTINIHWTFDGKTNWSAGCQVISGRSYINNHGIMIDCSRYSASGYSSVSWVSKSGVKKNRGAYTFISDFVHVYSQKDYVLYTLGRDGAVEQFADQELLDLLKDQLPGRSFNSDAGGEAIVHAMINRMTSLG